MKAAWIFTPSKANHYVNFFFFLISWKLAFHLAGRQNAVWVPVRADCNSSRLFRLRSPFFCLKLVEKGAEACVHYGTEKAIMWDLWLWAKASRLPKYHCQVSTCLRDHCASSRPAAFTTDNVVHFLTIPYRSLTSFYADCNINLFFFNTDFSVPKLGVGAGTAQFTQNLVSCWNVL